MHGGGGHVKVRNTLLLLLGFAFQKKFSDVWFEKLEGTTERWGLTKNVKEIKLQEWRQQNYEDIAIKLQ